MDEERLVRASGLADLGRFQEAYDEFVQLAESTPDSLERAWPLLHSTSMLQALGKHEAAIIQLSAVRNLIEKHRSCEGSTGEEFAAAETFLDFQEANLAWMGGENLEAALNKFETALNRHRRALKDPRAATLYEGIQIRRAFLLADLGRWKEALQILETIRSPQEYKESVAFYLGHCYSSAHELGRAEEKLTEALKLGLPKHLEFRAHCELGATYYNLGDYANAKREFQKGAQMADASYLKNSQVWRWLELTCMALGQRSEAEEYARKAAPS